MTTAPSLPERLAALPELGVVTWALLLRDHPRGEIRRALRADGRLVRLGRGVYARPQWSTRLRVFLLPSADQVAYALAAQWNEAFVDPSAVAAQRFRLTTQVPMRQMFWTRRRQGELWFGRLRVGFFPAPHPWLLVAPHTRAGNAARALAHVEPHEAPAAARALRATLRGEGYGADWEALVGLAGDLPDWMAHALRAADGPA